MGGTVGLKPSLVKIVLSVYFQLELISVLVHVLVFHTSCFLCTDVTGHNEDNIYFICRSNNSFKTEVLSINV